MLFLSKKMIVTRFLQYIFSNQLINPRYMLHVTKVEKIYSNLIYEISTNDSIDFCNATLRQFYQ